MNDIEFEAPNRLQKIVKFILNPIANYTPAFLMKTILKFRCETAELNWKNPGGWNTMLMYYENRSKYLADVMMTKCSSIGMALRNRRKIVANVISDCIDRNRRDNPHVVCLGAGPGVIINDALKACSRPKATATLVDLNADSFEYGRQLAIQNNLEHRMTWITADVRNIDAWLTNKNIDIVKMIGICEYLTDEKIKNIISEVSSVMPIGSKIVVNSISDIHGNDRFFRNILGINLRYRTTNDIEKFLIGFGHFEIHTEPTGIFSVVVGTKR